MRPPLQSCRHHNSIIPIASINAPGHTTRPARESRLRIAAKGCQVRLAISPSTLACFRAFVAKLGRGVCKLLSFLLLTTADVILNSIDEAPVPSPLARTAIKTVRHNLCQTQSRTVDPCPSATVAARPGANLCIVGWGKSPPCARRKTFAARSITINLPYPQFISPISALRVLKAKSMPVLTLNCGKGRKCCVEILISETNCG